MTRNNPATTTLKDYNAALSRSNCGYSPPDLLGAQHDELKNIPTSSNLSSPTSWTTWTLRILATIGAVQTARWAWNKWFSSKGGSSKAIDQSKRAETIQNANIEALFNPITLATIDASDNYDLVARVAAISGLRLSSASEPHVMLEGLSAMTAGKYIETTQGDTIFDPSELSSLLKDSSVTAFLASIGLNNTITEDQLTALSNMSDLSSYRYFDFLGYFIQQNINLIKQADHDTFG